MKLKPKLTTLQELAPELFVTNKTPTLVKVCASSFPPEVKDNGEHWGFGNPINLSGRDFIRANKEKATYQSVDISRLVINARKGTFIAYQNFLDPDSNFYTPSYLHKNKNKPIAATDLFKLNKQRLTLRKIMESIAVKKQSPDSVEIHQFDGNRRRFRVGDENVTFLKYYQQFKENLSKYQSDSETLLNQGTTPL